MAAKISFFPVDNGDMTLINLEDNSRILIDCNIRQWNEESEFMDVAKELRKRLPKDGKGRPFVDVFLLSHPDHDHCRGFNQHFFVGGIEDYAKEPENDSARIFVKEIWSSPVVFRRFSKNDTGEILSSDAESFQGEVRRRVKFFRDQKGDYSKIQDGNKVLVIGHDESDKTKGLEKITYDPGESFNKVRGIANEHIRCQVLGPLPLAEIDTEEEILCKNDSSVILNMHISPGKDGNNGVKFLTGGDSEVAIWQRLWEKHKATTVLEYDLLLVPHHCSWHSLSSDSISKSANPKVNTDSKKALSQARNGAFLIASSKPIKEKDADPPAVKAKEEYEQISKSVNGRFICVGEKTNGTKPEILEVLVEKEGARTENKTFSVLTSQAQKGSAKEPLPHG